MEAVPTEKQHDILSGFSPWPRRSAFGDAAGPLLFRRQGDRLTFAVRVEERHANASGRHAHGGMLSTFADLALGYSLALSTDPPTAILPVGLSIDFIRPVPVGDVVMTTPEVLRLGKRLAHASAVLYVRDTAVGRVSATAAVAPPRQGSEDQERRGANPEPSPSDDLAELGGSDRRTEAEDAPD